MCMKLMDEYKKGDAKYRTHHQPVIIIAADEQPTRSLSSGGGKPAHRF